MYCKNCGNTVDANAAVCVSCGTPIGQGEGYCPNCGNPVDPGAAACMACGAALKEAPKPQVSFTGTPLKSKMAAGLLGIFLGSLGIHNFYLGYTKKAVCQLLISVLTCGTLSFISGIWGLVEGIMILSGSINIDANGNPLSE